ncbi:MAG TPA: radical SAM protein [Propionicimonas sp.]|nr:radical SAM protein [Propionicimonas sp.]
MSAAGRLPGRVRDPAEPSGGSSARVVELADGPLGAYVHVPFCARVCPFCPYNKVIPRAGQPERYFDALLAEARGYVEAGAAGAAGFTSLYVGGGTPTLFPDLLRPVLDAIPVAGERAIEVLPNHATAERLDALRQLGFTAVSIGVQSFSDEVLHHLRRPHDARQAREALANAVGRFDLVDADLILDVEYDDAHAGTFLHDLVQCFELGVDQVSTYPLMRFGYTAFGPAADDRRREHEVLAEATRLAVEHGYERRSVWTFNRPDSPSYTSITRRRYLGLGAGASSFLGRDFLVNHFGVETYIAAVDAGRLPVARRLHLGWLGGPSYDAFWQAYSGRLCVPARGSGEAAGVPLRAAAAVMTAGGLLAPAVPGGCHALTPLGFDCYHDLERWVTYHLIEPLWSEMLAEHASEGGRAGWAAPESARRRRLWNVVETLTRRPL